MAADSAYRKWQDTVDADVNNPHFGDYDQQIKAAVGEFNTR